MAPSPRKSPAQKPRKKTNIRRHDPSKAYNLAAKMVADVSKSHGTRLDLSIPGLQKIPPLSALQDLKSINLSNTDIDDLEPLAGLRALESIDLSSTSVSDVTLIGEIRTIKFLDVSFTSLRGNDFLKDIRKLPVLRTLRAGMIQLSDLQPLKHFPALRELHVWSNPIEDISPIAELAGLEEFNIGGTQVTNLSPLGGLKNLKALYFWEDNVSDISVLSELSSLEYLNFHGTQAESLTAISGLTYLQHLIVRNSPLHSIEPISSLSNLQTLDIKSTKVSELDALAELTSLIEGANAAPEGSGLDFANCPLSDRKLLKYSELKNPRRTIATINYLRERGGLKPYNPQSSNEAGKILSAAHENPLGAKTVTRGEFIALASSGEPTDSAVAGDPTARQLHEQLKQRTGPLKELAHRIQNQIGWANFSATSTAFDSLASKSIEELAEQIGEFWSLSASLGGFAVQDDEARRNQNSFISPLEPDQRRILDDALTIAAVFVRRFPTARQLDNDLRDFRAESETTTAARKVVEASLRSQALLPEHGVILQGMLATPNSDAVLNNKAQGRAEATTYNIVLKALRICVFGAAGGIAAGYGAQIGTDVAQRDALGKKVADFVVNGEQSLLDFLRHAPADLQSALREILKKLKS
jgi:hypothetical protein